MEVTQTKTYSLNESLKNSREKYLPNPIKIKHDFPTKRINGQMSGFYHGTGHGLGLEIHEWPRMGKTSTDTLKSGNVMTVEPGLYYYGVGGVRLEDVIVVRSGKARVLTSFEKVLEI